MSVTNRRDARDENVKIQYGFRLAHESRAVADTAVTVLGETAPPVQYFTPSGTGPAVVRLPLAAKDGTVFIVVNLAAATNAITLTDDAGTPVTIGTIEADSTMWAHKVGAAYRLLGDTTTND
jgi:hypothetical protein